MRVWIAAATLVLAACHPKSENKPLEEARDEIPASPVSRATIAQAVPETPQSIEVGGEVWVSRGQPQRLPENGLRQVAGAAGTGVYALGWDDPPYDRLWVPAGVGYIEYVALRGGPAPERATGGGEEAAPAGVTTDSAAVEGSSGAPADTHEEGTP